MFLKEDEFLKEYEFRGPYPFPKGDGSSDSLAWIRFKDPSGASAK